MSALLSAIARRSVSRAASGDISAALFTSGTVEIFEWLQSPVMIRAKGITLVGHGNADGQSVTAYNHSTEALTTTDITVAGGTQPNNPPDDHYAPTFVYDPTGDKFITFFCGNRGGNSGYYTRTSSDGVTWSAETLITGYTGVAYPSPRVVNDQLYVHFRRKSSNQNEWVMHTLDWAGVTRGSTIATWYKDSLHADNLGHSGEKPYVQTWCDSNNVRGGTGERMDFAYTSASPVPGANHLSEIRSCYFDGTSFRAHDGTLIGDGADGPWNDISQGTLVNKVTGTTGQWTIDVAYAPNGDPMIFWFETPNNSGGPHDSKNYYVSRWNGSAWSKELVATVAETFSSAGNSPNYPNAGMIYRHNGDYLVMPRVSGNGKLSVSFYNWNGSTWDAWSELNPSPTTDCYRPVWAVQADGTPTLGAPGTIAWNGGAAGEFYTNWGGTGEYQTAAHGNQAAFTP